MKRSLFLTPLSQQTCHIIESLLEKIDIAYRGRDDLDIVTLDEASSLLKRQEIELVKSVRSIIPSDYNVHTPYLGDEVVPKKIIRINSMSYLGPNDERLFTKAQYVPADMLLAYKAMATALKKDVGHPLLITSSYRSTTYQAIVFLSYLYRSDYDVAQTVRRVAIPGYSEHCTPMCLAFDFQTDRGQPSDDNPGDFALTQEYRWLLTHANEYGFHLSYPLSNAYGIIFEPWHWRYIPKSDS